MIYQVLKIVDGGLDGEYSLGHFTTREKAEKVVEKNTPNLENLEVLEIVPITLDVEYTALGNEVGPI